jgi:long-chain acyl-CoA synthetase
MKYACLNTEFDADGGDLTRLRKLKRRAIEERYGGLVKSMYSGSEEFLMEAPILYSDGSKGGIQTALKIWEVKAREGA